MRPLLIKHLPSRFSRLALLCLLTPIIAAYVVAAPKAPSKGVVLPSTPFQYGPWRAVKMGGGGYIQNVVFTRNPRVNYAYADVAGPWRTDDGGQRWRALYGTLPSRPSYGVRSLSVDPRDENNLVIACGWQWGPVDGIYRSTNGGQSWQKVLTAQFYANEAQRSSGVLLARNPKAPDKLLVASGGDGVFASEDNGLTWQKTGIEGIYPTDLKFDSVNPQQVWLCSVAQESIWSRGKKISLGGGYWHSDDGGATWRKVAEKSPREVVQDPGEPQRWFGILDGKTVGMSRDGGATWSEASQGLNIGDASGLTSEQRYDSLAAGPDFMLTASRRGTFYRLNKGSDTWQKIERQGVEEQYEGALWMSALQRSKPGEWQHLGAALNSIVVDPRDPKHWWFTDWFAAYQTHDAGKHWQLSINGIELTVLHAIAQDPSDPGTVHMGMADNGYLRSEDGGERFTSLRTNSNMKGIAVAPSLASRVYAVGDNNTGAWESNQVFVSNDRGHSWTKSPQTGLPDPKQFHWNSIAVHPKQPDTVYLAVSGEIGEGKGGVYVSRDGGAQWQWMGQGLDAKGIFRFEIWAIGRELAVSDDGTVVAISRDRHSAYFYDDKALRWNRAPSDWEGEPRSVTAVPGSRSRFLMGVMGAGVYRSEDAGRTWKRVLKSSAQYVALDASKPNRIAAGTEDGVALSEDGGDTWKSLDKALPYRYYGIPAFAGERLLLGTIGGGAYWMPLSPAGARPIQARAAK